MTRSAYGRASDIARFALRNMAEITINEVKAGLASGQMSSTTAKANLFEAEHLLTMLTLVSNEAVRHSERALRDGYSALSVAAKEAADAHADVARAKRKYAAACAKAAARN